ncbi:MAG: ribosome biogenesis GTP-binding protein YihA/YsxC [Candidatus Howiella sp.]|jgi:GTP-binding protein
MNYNNVCFETAVGTAAQLAPGDLPEVCFSGRSNVGKSSLLNRVLGRKALARVSGRPGKTATINFYRLEGLRLADLPGYGFAKVARSEKVRWGNMMERYFGSDRPIALVIQLIDMRHSPSEDDLYMLRFLCDAGLSFAVALTKSDKLNVSERAARLSALKTELDFLPQGTPVIPFSATKGEGTEEIRGLLEAAAKRER